MAGGLPLPDAGINISFSEPAFSPTPDWVRIDSDERTCATLGAAVSFVVRKR